MSGKGFLMLGEGQKTEETEEEREAREERAERAKKRGKPEPIEPFLEGLGLRLDDEKMDTLTHLHDFTYRYYCENGQLKKGWLTDLIVEFDLLPAQYRETVTEFIFRVVVGDDYLREAGAVMVGVKRPFDVS